MNVNAKDGAANFSTTDRTVGRAKGLKQTVMRTVVKFLTYLVPTVLRPAKKTSTEKYILLA